MFMQKARFIRLVNTYYTIHGRHTLPWRLTNDPYKIIVSEIMLQQTQVARVLEKYTEFLALFPTVQILAEASLQDVLRVWTGLGYNRRAKFLKQMAVAIVSEYNGVFPKTIAQLQTLPGIGPYTARAVAAFAYNIPSAFIETNIRTIYLHHFFEGQEGVTDAQLMEKIEATLDRDHPREWYWALMDYGAHLKRMGIRAHRASTHYVRQSAFKGSKRAVRGRIIAILKDAPCTTIRLYKRIEEEKERIDTVLADLQKEQFIVFKNRTWMIQ